MHWLCTLLLNPWDSRQINPCLRDLATSELTLLLVSTVAWPNTVYVNMLNRASPRHKMAKQLLWCQNQQGSPKSNRIRARSTGKIHKCLCFFFNEASVVFKEYKACFLIFDVFCVHLCSLSVITEYLFIFIFFYRLAISNLQLYSCYNQ